MPTKKQTQIRVPTKMQADAVRIYGAGGKTKGEALKEAGYAETVQKSPDKVFGSPGVQEIMEQVGLKPTATLRKLKQKTNRRMLKYMYFPPYDPNYEGSESIGNGDIGAEGYLLTDDEIKKMLKQAQCNVVKVLHRQGKSPGRTVYYWTDNDDVQMDALKEVISIFGLHAPKKQEVKGEHLIGTFSLTGLHEQAKERGESYFDYEDQD